ncbi:Uncharacterised protein [Legionella busanensis]|uniref:Lipoprotein n=1 Tax=Legionella busanensis TaxID=190655 RepID=A0A378K9M2_9GAMM|nr:MULTISPECIES: hypothetical protein [Legionella]STX81648.1 Uncharacterised protein [Legionella busanensis]
MNNIKFCILCFIGIFVLGLTACTTQPSPTSAEPSNTYGDFGGDGGHIHQNKENI